MIIRLVKHSFILFYCLDRSSSDLNQQSKISINIFYTYKKKIKESFLFMKADDCLIVLGKMDQQIKVNILFIRILQKNTIQ